MNYIEIIILINLLIHNLFIAITNYILSSKNRIFPILLSNFVDIVYIILYIYFPYKFDNYQYVFVLIISIIPFIKKRLYITLLGSIIYLLLNFTLGGTSKIIYYILESFYSVILALITIYISFLIIAIYKKIKFNIKNLNYDIIIKDKNKELFLNGYIDTGNILTSDDNIPIVFLDKSIKIGTFKKKIKINTVSICKYIDIYSIESFKIKINNKYIVKDVYIAFTNLHTSCMFGINLLGG